MWCYVNENNKNNQKRNHNKKEFTVKMMHKWQVLGGKKRSRGQTPPPVTVAIRKHHRLLLSLPREET